MSLLHVQQIKANLQKLFSGLIDVSDFAGRTADEESAFLSRSLAAFALMHLAGLTEQQAANAVTDGGQDNGLDAIHYDSKEKYLYLVQSKWRHDGTGSLERAEVMKFVTGFRDLVDASFERFNAKVNARRAEIEAAITDANTRFVLTVVYSGQDPLATEPQRDLDDLLREMNDPTDLVVLRVLRQVDVHSIIATGIKGAPINLEVALTDWGLTSEPYKAYYGQIAAADVATWWENHHSRLFAPNLRIFLGATDVNDAILDTLRNRPEQFWYFNNGITALCGSMSKKPIGGSNRDSGIFECADVTVVNGAQTVGSIAAAHATHAEAVARARVSIRFISLEDCPVDFSRDVTRFTNTQNRIERRDFVALDPEQERIRTELQLESVEYVYKSGDSVSPQGQGFDLAEATIALACSQEDIALAVQAKREIGKLWEDISKAPYRALFNASLSGPKLWRLVQTQRMIDMTLGKQYRARVGREKMTAIHGNRVVSWCVFRALPTGGELDGAYQSWVEELTRRTLDNVTAVANACYRESYLASLFKNLTKCRDISVKVPPLSP